MPEDKASYSIKDVRRIVAAALSQVGQNEQATKEKLFNELQELASLINGVCHEFSGDKETIHSGKGDISKATEELAQVVSATEKASDIIMDSCEQIQDFATQSATPETDKILAETAKIFEACSFQDITGQRINNAVKSLLEIEQRIDRLIELLNKDGRFNVSHAESEDTREGDEALKNGPQMPDNAMTQEEIDRLLAD